VQEEAVAVTTLQLYKQVVQVAEVTALLQTQLLQQVVLQILVQVAVAVHLL
jgi:hypothetical protein